MYITYYSWVHFHLIQFPFETARLHWTKKTKRSKHPLSSKLPCLCTYTPHNFLPPALISPYTTFLLICTFLHTKIRHINLTVILFHMFVLKHIFHANLYQIFKSKLCTIFLIRIPVTSKVGKNRKYFYTCTIWPTLSFQYGLLSSLFAVMESTFFYM